MVNSMMMSIYIWIVNLYTNSELKILGFGATCGAVFSSAIGGTDQQVTALIQLAVVDYATGLIAGWKTKTLGSNRGTKGMFKKIAIFAAVALANTVDNAMATHTLRTAAICGFAGVEAMSIIENVDRMGYGDLIPPFIREKLIQLREEKGVNMGGNK